MYCTLAPVTVRVLNARVQVSAKTHGGGMRAEDIDKIIPPALPFPYSRIPTARIIPEHPSRASLRHISLESICPSRSLLLFHPLERGSPTYREGEKGVVRGQEDMRGGWEGVGERTSGNRPGRHSRNDFVLRACLIMNPHPGEAPPPFARRTTTSNSSSSRGSSRRGGRGYTGRRGWRERCVAGS